MTETTAARSNDQRRAAVALSICIVLLALGLPTMFLPEVVQEAQLTLRNAFSSVNVYAGQAVFAGNDTSPWKPRATCVSIVVDDGAQRSLVYDTSHECEDRVPGFRLIKNGLDLVVYRYLTNALSWKKSNPTGAASFMRQLGAWACRRAIPKNAGERAATIAVAQSFRHVSSGLVEADRYVFFTHDCRTGKGRAPVYKDWHDAMKGLTR